MSDDHLVAEIVSKCREIMKGFHTQTKMTACFNLTVGVFRLFCLQGSKKDLENMADEFAIGMKNEIDE